MSLLSSAARGLGHMCLAPGIASFTSSAVRSTLTAVRARTTAACTSWLPWRGGGMAVALRSPQTMTRHAPGGGLLANRPPPMALLPFPPSAAAQARTFASRRFHKKKIIRMAKGYRGRANRCYRIAVKRVEKALQHAYRDRKNRKRDFRRLWIARVNAGVRQHGLSYSAFVKRLHESGCQLNRRMLADLAGMEPFSFKAVVDVVKMRSAVADAAGGAK